MGFSSKKPKNGVKTAFFPLCLLRNRQANFRALGAPKGAPLEARREAGADVGEVRHALEALIAVYRETL